MRKCRLLIANEGPDGSGKETQTTLLCERLRREGVRVARVDFPTYGDDPVADSIRFLLRERKEEWNTRTWESKALLYASNRHRTFSRLSGVEVSVIVCNRFVPSNQAHMAAYSEDPAEWERRFAWIEHLEYDLLGLPRPDLVLLHTMPSRKRTELLQHREQGKQDAHEANAAYLNRVEQCYVALAQRDPEHWIHIRADVGRSTGSGATRSASGVDGVVESADAVHERVWNALTIHSAWVQFQQALRIPVL